MNNSRVWDGLWRYWLGIPAEWMWWEAQVVELDSDPVHGTFRGSEQLPSCSGTSPSQEETDRRAMDTTNTRQSAAIALPALLCLQWGVTLMTPHHHGSSEVLRWGKEGSLRRCPDTNPPGGRQTPAAPRSAPVGDICTASPPPGRLRAAGRELPALPPLPGAGSGAVPGRAAANDAAGAARAVQEHPGGDSDAPPSRRRAGAGEHGRGAALSRRRRPGKGGRPCAPASAEGSAAPAPPRGSV